MGKKYVVGLALLALVAGTNGVRGQNTKATTTAPSTVMAKVGERQLTYGDLEAMKKYLAGPNVEDARLIQMWKFRAALANLADREKFTQDPEAQAALRILRDQMIVSMFMQNKQKNVTVTDQEIKDHYAKNQDRREYREPESVSVRLLAVEKKEKADEIKKQLVGGAKFDALRSEYRDGTLKITGLSDTEMKNVSVVHLSRSLGPVAWAMTRAELNEVIGPRQVNQGWAFFQVTERKPGKPQPLERILPTIKAELMQKKQMEIQKAMVQAAEKESGVSLESMQRPNRNSPMISTRPFRKVAPQTGPVVPPKK